MPRLSLLPLVFCSLVLAAHAQVSPGTPPAPAPAPQVIPPPVDAAGNIIVPDAPQPEPTAPEAPPSDLVKKIQAEILTQNYVPPENLPDPSIPKGEMLTTTITDSAIYPGTENLIKVYVPAAYDASKPACLLVSLDGFGGPQMNVLDHLIASKEMPVTIALGIVPGAIYTEPQPINPKQQRKAARYNRCYEFDSTNEHFPDFIINEVLPAVQKLTTKDGRAIKISDDPNDRATTGGSSGGIGAFTLAWRRPDQFSRVYATIGTFVPMRGGNEYAPLIRKTEAKPLRIFLEDGSADSWNPLLGSWFAANLNMETALNFAGYDVAHAWGTHGHGGKFTGGIFADVMRWLWRDYPTRITAGTSNNATLKDIIGTYPGWQKIDQEFQGATALAANAQGDVYFSDGPATTVYRLGADDKPAVFAQKTPALTGAAFGPDGTLYGTDTAGKKVIALDAQGMSKTIADGVAGHGILVRNDGTIYVSEPGEHPDLPSQIWQIKPTGEKKSMDQGLSLATGIAFTSDATLFFAAEKTTQWIYSYVVQPDGTFTDKQPYYWLHQTDIPNNSGAEQLALDKKGELYVATNLGVQVCDHNGRVRAILPLPTPCGPVVGICFGRAGFNYLYVTDGKHVFKRQMNVGGISPWRPPQPYPSEGAG